MITLNTTRYCERCDIDAPHLHYVYGPTEGDIETGHCLLCRADRDCVDWDIPCDSDDM